MFSLGERLAEDGEDGREALAAIVMMLGDVVLEPVDEAGGFLGEADANEGVDGEGGVAEPGEAIVPVARTADDFGEAGGDGGDDGAGGLEREKLQREGGTLDAIAPAAVIGAGGEPVLPEFYGAFERLGGFCFGVRMGWLPGWRLGRRRSGK